MSLQSTSPRAGFAALLGAPNAGKSTLLNQLVGQKVSIISSKPQTTRTRVLGLFNEGSTQIGLIDTPGIFDSKGNLDKAMVQAAWQSLEDADLVLLVMDSNLRHVPDAAGAAVIEGLKKRNQKVTLVLNKTDKISPPKLLPIVEKLNATGVFDAVFMISALTGDGVAELKKHIIEHMPEGPWLFPEDQLTDVSERLLAAEATREQLFERLHEELPYSAAVVPESWEERKDGSVLIRQTILVSRPNHRAIVLGKGGSFIKSIGEAARKSISDEIGRPVHLFLEVKVDENWKEKPDFYQLFGLEPPRRAKRR